MKKEKVLGRIFDQIICFFDCYIIFPCVNKLSDLVLIAYRKQTNKIRKSSR